MSKKYSIVNKIIRKREIFKLKEFLTKCFYPELENLNKKISTFRINVQIN